MTGRYRIVSVKNVTIQNVEVLPSRQPPEWEHESYYSLQQQHLHQIQKGGSLHLGPDVSSCRCDKRVKKEFSPALLGPMLAGAAGALHGRTPIAAYPLEQPQAELLRLEANSLSLRLLALRHGRIKLRR
ncbi:hypothetical protein MSG28_007803 [Choristoneura fumiferana]|uniref:Uncharacterized protein n=1 Tax=Choristoneura fumiferana TaxID=7141 RepID=A0ACC0JYV5_CHOFU|nr:hypothetical protein MSG28_007803 [Choristoneura fumiferana]